MAGTSVEMKGGKKLPYAVNQVRPLKLTVMFQERKTTFILDELIQFTYSIVNAFRNIKAEVQIFIDQCCIV